ncbi:MAG: GspH/FimT family pseudopilin [Gammaproteobacteria bacterium]|jgi:prepilin-type N-terminal cleavage/methylation domain-containing protein
MHQRQRGYSLPELLAVVIILGITAAVVVPDISTTNPNTLDLAAEQVAQAIRYARSESLRTGEIHGVEISQNTQRVVAYKADLTTTPVSIADILYHPVSKQKLDYDVDTGPMTDGVSITNTQDPFLYATGRRNNLLFDHTGVPIWIVNSTGTTYILQDGMVQLSDGGDNRSVRVAQITGRVTVQ